MGIYAVLGLVTFSVALDLRGALARAAAPGVLWMTVTLPACWASAGQWSASKSNRPWTAFSSRPSTAA